MVEAFEGNLEQVISGSCTCDLGLFVGYLLALFPSNMLVYLRDRSAQASVCAAMLR